jgi:DNA-binding response OmpR family regulator/HPt (histidine-containing phosphotransfer) domain-containing protein
MKILVVEDDLLLAEALRSTLASHNYAVEVAHDGRAGLDCIEAFNYDLLLLDVVLPKLDGISLCHHIRSQGYTMPILLLTSKDSNHDRAVGLDAGADDYVIKPCDPEELSARIRALLRRGTDNVRSILTWKDLTLDPRNCQVTYQERVLTLTPKEYALLELFLRHNQRLFSCGAILEHLWTYEDAPSEEAVRTHVKGLRQKLKAVGAPHNLVETVYGIGYRLKSFDSIPLQQDIAIDRSPQQVKITTPPTGTPTSTPPAQLVTTAPPATNADANQNGSQVGAEESTSPMLVEIWNRYSDQMSDRVESIELAIAALTTQSLSAEARLQAWQSAHSLAGALGTFGLAQGSQAAKQIELLLDAKIELTPDKLDRLQAKVIELRQDISRKMTVTSPEPAPPPPSGIAAPVQQVRHVSGGNPDRLASNGSSRMAAPTAINSPAVDREPIRLLAISTAPDLAANLRAVGAGRFEVFGTDRLVPERSSLVPDAIVFDLDCFADRPDWLRALSALERDYPTVPVLVLSHSDNSNELRSTGLPAPVDRVQQLYQRVEVARRGGRMFLVKPIAAGEILQGIERVLPRSSAKPMRIVIVDDDRILLEGLTALLSRSNMQVTTLSEPSRFWETLEAAQPDLLILDLDMPTYNGIELCRAVRTDPQWATLPIMFLTAHTATIAIDRIFAAGADDLVTKPTLAAELVTRIVNRLERLEQRAFARSR